MLKLTDFFKVKEGELFDLSLEDKKSGTFAIKNNSLHILLPSDKKLNDLANYDLKKVEYKNFVNELDESHKVAPLANISRNTIITPNEYEPTTITFNNVIQYDNENKSDKFKLNIHQLTALYNIYNINEFKYLSVSKFDFDKNISSYSIFLHSEKPFLDDDIWNSNGEVFEFDCYKDLFKNIPTDKIITLSDYSSEFEQLDSILNNIKFVN